METATSVEAAILDRLLKGTLSLDFARDLFRQRDLFLQNERKYAARFRGKCLAMVDETLVAGDHDLALIERIRAEYPDQPFYLHTRAVIPNGGRNIIGCTSDALITDFAAKAARNAEMTRTPAMHAVPQGSARSSDWTASHAWPAIVAPENTFPIEVQLTPRRPLKFAAIAFEVPNGFEVVDGDLTRTFIDVAEPLDFRIWVKAPSAGDHFWKTLVRSERRRAEVIGRIVVRR